MNLHKSILAAAGILMIACGISYAKPKKAKVLPAEVKLTKQVLQDKIWGAWAGQVIGCTYGGPTEFKYSNFIPDDYPIDWNEHLVKWWYDHSPGLYDDVYMDLTFVEVFDKEGVDAPVESFAKAFAYAGYPLWHANLQARYNILQGIMPPESGHWKNNTHADDIDFQIEADYAGIMAPGMVNSAVKYTDDIGHIMNYGDGWYGGVCPGLRIQRYPLHSQGGPQDHPRAEQVLQVHGGCHQVVGEVPGRLAHHLGAGEREIWL